MTGENVSVELTGNDMKLVVAESFVPEIGSLLQNESVTGPLTVTETKNGETTVYQAQKQQLSVDNQGYITTADGYCRVVFDSGDGAVKGVVAAKGSPVAQPDDPIRDGFEFVGWYTEEACVNEWDFERDTVENEITLYAKWTFFVGAITGVNRVYNGEPVVLKVRNQSAASYQWYKDGEAILAGTGYTVTLNGNVADSGSYYCVATLEGASAQTNTAAVTISKATVEFFVEDLVIPQGIVTKQRYATFRAQRFLLI